MSSTKQYFDENPPRLGLERDHSDPSSGNRDGWILIWPLEGTRGRSPRWLLGWVGVSPVWWAGTVASPGWPGGGPAAPCLSPQLGSLVLWQSPGPLCWESQTVHYRSLHREIMIPYLGLNNTILAPRISLSWKATKKYEQLQLSNCSYYSCFIYSGAPRLWI